MHFCVFAYKVMSYLQKLRLYVLNAYCLGLYHKNVNFVIVLEHTSLSPAWLKYIESRKKWTFKNSLFYC